MRVGGTTRDIPHAGHRICVMGRDGWEVRGKGKAKGSSKYIERKPEKIVC